MLLAVLKMVPLPLLASVYPPSLVYQLLIFILQDDYYESENSGLEVWVSFTKRSLINQKVDRRD